MSLHHKSLRGNNIHYNDIYCNLGPGLFVESNGIPIDLVCRVQAMPPASGLVFVGRFGPQCQRPCADRLLQPRGGCALAPFA
jgi:hypothetical protein